MSPELKQAIEIISTVTICTALLPLVIGFVRWKNAPKAFRIVTVLIGIGFIFDVVITIYPKEHFTFYMPRIYTLIEYSLITLFFCWITKRRVLRIIYLLTAIPFVAIAAFDYLTGGLLNRDDLSIGVEALIFISWSVITLYNILRDADYRNILETPHFWIISGLMTYFGGNIFIFITSNSFNEHHRELGTFFWAGHAVLSFLFYLQTAMGLWKTKEHA